MNISILASPALAIIISFFSKFIHGTLTNPNAYIFSENDNIPGFIFMIYFTDLFNFTLSIHRLRVITKFRLPFKQILSSLVCAWGSVSLTSFFTRIVGLAASPTAWSLTFEIILSLAVYTALLFLLGCLVPKDVKWFKSHFAPKRSPAGQ
jgi:hypothetical protein